jgi:hypothetical protein
MPSFMHHRLWIAMWRYAYRFPNPSLRDRRYKIHVQDSWSFGAIE